VVIALRVASALVVAAPMSLVLTRRRGRPTSRVRRSRGARAPLVANLASFGVFLASLIASSGSSAGYRGVLLAASGCALALTGTAVVLGSRAELGAAWSLVPTVGEDTGLVTTGPYQVVRHPIYLGLSVIALGEALAFASWPALTIAVVAILPTFAWRAHAEEQLLGRTFGERYAEYRRRTRMIIPYVL
jgi:protein-S-isoprenylcysteine O-methyltransferase Ste14